VGLDQLLVTDLLPLSPTPQAVVDQSPQLLRTFTVVGLSVQFNLIGHGQFS
jgi:hypothetical protein